MAGSVSYAPFSATLARDEAVLRFPYDEGLRQLLRAIPGRRWDPLERVWRVPLDPESAQALTRLLSASTPYSVVDSPLTFGLCTRDHFLPFQCRSSEVDTVDASGISDPAAQTSVADTAVTRPASRTG